MIKSDLSICPKRIREAPHAYLRWLLKKAPTEIAKKCKEIEHQINVAERRQVEPMFNSELLTVNVLTYEMIEMISAASKENQISIVEVAAADKKRKLSSERVKMSKSPPCANCGSAEHGWGDCKATTEFVGRIIGTDNSANLTLSAGTATPGRRRRTRGRPPASPCAWPQARPQAQARPHQQARPLGLRGLRGLACCQRGLHRSKVSCLDRKPRPRARAPASG